MPQSSRSPKPRPLFSPRRCSGAALLMLLLPLAACTGSGDDPVADAADELSTALSGHTLDGVALVEPVSADAFEELVAPLAGYDVEVAADDEIERDGDAASVLLHWRWDIEGHEWAYDTTARLVEAEDEWEVDWDASTLLPEIAPDERIDVTREFSPRADIIGAHEEAIVTDRPVGRYGMDKAAIDADDVGESAERIAGAVGIDPGAFREAAENAGPQAFVEAIVVREGDEGEHVSDDFSDIPGALVVEDTLPLAPSRTFARELLGSVGEATAEAIEASDGSVRAGDRVGLSGLQVRHDATLRGTPSVEIDAVAADDSRRGIAHWEGVDGEPLVLTLDQAVQTDAEEILAGMGDDAPAAAIVAIRPSKGEILAVANGAGSEGMNIATTGSYAPGSTFKLVTALALVRSGLALDDTVSCPEQIDVDGFAFHNDDGYPDSAVGDITFRTAIAHSCNTALIGERDRIADGALTEAAEALGLGTEIDLGYPASLGQVPDPESETERAADLIGQGRVTATPLAMAAVAASVHAGHAVVPHLIADDAGAATPAAPLTETEAAALQDLMRAVVTEGSAAFLGSIPGDPVGAKTGTAEYGEPDEDGDYATHSWMVGTHGDLAAAVFVESGESGAATAGPLLSALFERW